MAITREDIANKAGAAKTAFDSEFSRQTQGSPNISRQSIIGQAKQNIFEFPVFVADTLPLEFATATVSLLEQVYASFLQMAISAKPLVTGDQIRRGKQFSHLKTDTGKYLEYTEDMDYVHDACQNKIVTESGLVYEYELISYDNDTARIFNEYLEHNPLSEFSHIFQEATYEDINQQIFTLQARLSEEGVDAAEKKKIKENIENLKGASEVMEKIEKKGIERSKLNIAAAKEGREAAKAQSDDESKYAVYYINKETEKIAQLTKDLQGMDETHPEWDMKMAQITASKDKIAKLDLDAVAQSNKHTKDINDIEIQTSRELRDRMVKAPEMLRDQDIQKLNTMKPLMMVVRLRRDSDSESEPYEFVIGVKCRIRMIPAEMMPEVAAFPLKEMNKISRKVRWKSGELKFFKDLLFKIPQRKQTAVDARDPKRKWFRRLYELAHAGGDSMSANMMSSGKISASNLFNMTNFDGGVIPNASIIITKGIVDNVKAETGIDLLSASAATDLCKELFLISFIVIDTDSESIKVLLPDLHSDFEIHSLASVNKQLSTLDTAGVKTREMFKLL